MTLPCLAMQLTMHTKAVWSPSRLAASRPGHMLSAMLCTPFQVKSRSWRLQGCSGW